MRGLSFVVLTSAAFVLTLGGASCSPDQSLAPARNDAAPTATFRADVIPVMRKWCSNTNCHANIKTTLGIAFPIDDPSALYAQLQRESPTAKGAKFVVAGDPAKSFFFAKIVGDQAKFNCGSSCGETMPPGTKMDTTERDVIRRWIESGAKDD